MSPCPCLCFYDEILSLFCACVLGDLEGADSEGAYSEAGAGGGVAAGAGAAGAGQEARAAARHGSAKRPAAMRTKSVTQTMRPDCDADSEPGGDSDTYSSIDSDSPLEVNPAARDSIATDRDSDGDSDGGRCSTTTCSAPSPRAASGRPPCRCGAWRVTTYTHTAAAFRTSASPRASPFPPPRYSHTCLSAAPPKASRPAIPTPPSPLPTPAFPPSHATPRFRATPSRGEAAGGRGCVGRVVHAAAKGRQSDLHSRNKRLRRGALTFRATNGSVKHGDIAHSKTRARASTLPRKHSETR
jgi:hypothetical protein